MLEAATGDYQGYRIAGDYARVHVFHAQPIGNAAAAAVVRTLISDIESQDIRVLEHSIDPDTIRNQASEPQPQATSRASPPASPVRWSSGSGRVRHIGYVIDNWLQFSLSTSANSFIHDAKRVAAATVALLRSVIVLAVKLPAVLVNLPQDLKRVIFGQPVTPPQASPLAAAVAGISEPASAAVPEPVVIFTEALGTLDELIETDFLVPNSQSPTFVVFAPWSGDLPPLDDCIDRETLGPRWRSSAASTRTRLYTFDEAGAARLSQFLAVDVSTLDELALQLQGKWTADRPLQEGKPLAVVLRPAWVVCGSSTLFSNQTEYLAERGYQVLEIAVQQGFRRLDLVEQATETFLAQNRGSYAHKVLLLYLKVGLAPWLSQIAHNWTKVFSGQLARKAVAMELAELPAHWSAALADAPPELVVVNHCWHLPLAQKLFPDACQILETQDIQAHQLGVHANYFHGADEKIDSDRELKAELDLMRLGAAIVSINHSESKFFASMPKMPPVATIHPYMSESLLEAGRQPGPEGIEVGDEVPESIDVLLVASNHPGNVMSLRWFIREIFQPYLSSSDFSVLVVGDVVDGLEENEKVIPMTGRVPNVMVYYDRARLVALPVTSGTGLPIKTMEALSLGMPVVATSPALRGLRDADRALPVFDEPEAFAGEIRHLLTDDLHRTRVAQAGREMASQNFSREAYFDAWDGLISRVASRNHNH